MRNRPPSIVIGIAIATAALALAASFACGAAGANPAPASAPDPLARADVKTLAHAALADELARDREVIVDVVTIPPNTTLDRHWHPGEEFQYYLEGEVTMELEGQQSIVGKPGTVGHIPYRTLHTAKAGPNGAKILVFRVHTKGQPTRFAESEPRPGR